MNRLRKLDEDILQERIAFLEKSLQRIEKVGQIIADTLDRIERSLAEMNRYSSDNFL